MVNSTLEYKTLAVLLKRPEFTRFLNENLFSGERALVFRAMRSCYVNVGGASQEAVELYYGRPLPPEVLSAYDALPEGELKGKLNSYVLVLRDLSLRRSLSDVHNRVSMLLSDNQPLSLDRVKHAIKVESPVVNNSSDIGDGVVDFLEDLQTKINGEYKFTSTGIDYLDKFIGGEYARKGLTTIMGGSGGGKTSLVLDSMVKMATKYGIPTLFISLEMSKAKLVMRMVANLTGIDGLKIQNGDLTESEKEKIEDAVRTIQRLPIYIIDDPKMSLDSICFEVEKHTKEYNIRAFFVDYLQIIPSDVPMSDHEKYGHFAYTLRTVAVDNDIAAILISQQNRTGDGLSSLLGSSRPIHISDIVLELDLDVKSNESIKTVNFHVLKSRNSGTGSFIGVFDGRTMSFK